MGRMTWPETRRDERIVREILLARHPEIHAGVRAGHDGGDEDNFVADERAKIRNWAADMLERETGGAS